MSKTRRLSTKEQELLLRVLAVTHSPVEAELVRLGRIEITERDGTVLELDCEAR